MADHVALSAQTKGVEPAPPSRKQKSTKAARVPPFEANIERLADVQSGGTPGASPEILDRIRAMVALGDRSKNPSEAQAKTAIRMATRLMSQYNVQQADLAEHEAKSDTQTSISGESVVRITRTAGQTATQVLLESWHGTLAWAMNHFFDCKSYTTKPSDKTWVTVTFYGIASNTEVAARSFEMTFNIIQRWAMAQKGTKRDYIRGFAGGLYDTAKAEKAKDVNAAGSASNERKQPTQWQTPMELQLFRDNAIVIADKWLESNKKKLKNARKARNYTIHDHNAFAQGKADSLKVDVKGTRRVDEVA